MAKPRPGPSVGWALLLRFLTSIGAEDSCSSPSSSPPRSWGRPVASISWPFPIKGKSSALDAAVGVEEEEGLRRGLLAVACVAGLRRESTTGSSEGDTAGDSASSSSSSTTTLLDLPRCRFGALRACCLFLPREDGAALLAERADEEASAPAPGVRIHPGSLRGSETEPPPFGGVGG